MAWVKYDDRFTKHPKVRKAGKLLGGKYGLTRVVAFHHEATEYCNVHLTDGLLTREVVVEFDCDPNPIEVVTVLALKSVRLADRVRGGWKLHDYHDYQPAKKDVIEDRRKEAERKRRVRAGHRADKQGVRDLSHPDSGVESGVESGGPARPGPSRPVPAPIEDQEPAVAVACARGPDYPERPNVRVIAAVVRKSGLLSDGPDADEERKVAVARARVGPYSGEVIERATNMARATAARRES